MTAIAAPRLRVVAPSRRDPRLKLSAVIITLQVLGQAALGFKVSIAQILVSIAVCAAIDLGVTLRRDHVLAWPASGMLTGNGIGFILRASGTRHGDWWSLHGIEFFVLASVLAMASKHLIRPGGRHVFNPSNVGLVLCLLVIGPVHVFPQYLWWGPLGAPLGAALVVIALGAVVILREVRMAAMALAFTATFALAVAVLALAGRSFVAIWRPEAIRGAAYWLAICGSPELFVFVFFMMSDPRTAPRGARARVAYGAATALVAAALLSFQSTEFGVKLAILAGLTLVCALVPVVDGLTARRRPGAAAQTGRGPCGRARAPSPAVVAVVLVALTAGAGTAALAGDRQLTYIERGLTGRNAQ